MAAKPVLHGRDHLPGGADPIPASAGAGIQFDTSPQEGNWLEVGTTGATGITGINLYASGGNINISTSASHDIILYASGDLALQSATDDVTIDAFRHMLLDVGTGGSGIFEIQTPDDATIESDNLYLSQTGGLFVNTTSVEVLANGGDMDHIIADVGHKFTVSDSNGDPIFQVDENGGLHGKTGSALVFDL